MRVMVGSTTALSSANDNHSPREIRHMAYISEFTTDIRHVSGVDNNVADALSRIVMASQVLLPPSVDYQALARHQADDQELSKLRTTAPHLIFEQIHSETHGETVVCEMSTGTPRPSVPSSFRKQIFDSFRCMWL